MTVKHSSEVNNKKKSFLTAHCVCYLFMFNIYIIVCDFLIFWQIGTRGTVTEAAGFNPDEDVKKLREAMKGAGEWDKPWICWTV